MDPGPHPQPRTCLKRLWEASGTILQMRTLGPCGEGAQEEGAGHCQMVDMRATG